MDDQLNQGGKNDKQLKQGGNNNKKLNQNGNNGNDSTEDFTNENYIVSIEYQLLGNPVIHIIHNHKQYTITE